MADYSPIPLQAVAPDPMKPLAGLLNMATTAQALKKSQATFDADVAQRQAESSSAQSSAKVNAANVNPLIQQQAAQTSSAQTGATRDKFALDSQYQDKFKQIASGFANDPRLQAGNNYDPNAATKALMQAKQQVIDSGVPAEVAERSFAPLTAEVHQPGVVGQAFKNFTLGSMNSAQQVAANTPNYINTGGQFQNINPLQAAPQQSIQGTIAPGAQQAPTTDVNGNPAVLNRAPGGAITGVTPLPGQGGAPAPMMSYPAGESAQTKAALEQEALGAKGAAQGAQQMHDINRTILSEVDKGLNTGTLGQLTQKLSSATGYNVGDESSTGYNLLGKMLERSALTAAQSMGPHTNAGLEAAVRANGSLEYTPGAIKTIARLNDALTTGSEKYAQGVQTAIQNGGSVFAKRQFDQQWSQNADVNALKLLTASKNGDKEGVQEVIKAVGGPNSDGAKKLAQHLKNLQSLTTKGSL